MSSIQNQAFVCDYHLISKLPIDSSSLDSKGVAIRCTKMMHIEYDSKQINEKVLENHVQQLAEFAFKQLSTHLKVASTVYLKITKEKDGSCRIKVDATLGKDRHLVEICNEILVGGGPKGSDEEKMAWMLDLRRAIDDLPSTIVQQDKVKGQQAEVIEKNKEKDEIFKDMKCRKVVNDVKKKELKKRHFADSSSYLNSLDSKWKFVFITVLGGICSGGLALPLIYHYVVCKGVSLREEEEFLNNYNIENFLSDPRERQFEGISLTNEIVQKKVARFYEKSTEEELPEVLANMSAMTSSLERSKNRIQKTLKGPKETLKEAIKGCAREFSKDISELPFGKSLYMPLGYFVGDDYQKVMVEFSRSSDGTINLEMYNDDPRIMGVRKYPFVKFKLRPPLDTMGIESQLIREFPALDGILSDVNKAIANFEGKEKPNKRSIAKFEGAIEKELSKLEKMLHKKVTEGVKDGVDEKVNKQQIKNLRKMKTNIKSMRDYHVLIAQHPEVLELIQDLNETQKSDPEIYLLKVKEVKDKLGTLPGNYFQKNFKVINNHSSEIDSELKKLENNLNSKIDDLEASHEILEELNSHLKSEEEIESDNKGNLFSRFKKKWNEDRSQLKDADGSLKNRIQSFKVEIEETEEGIKQIKQRIENLQVKKESLKNSLNEIKDHSIQMKSQIEENIIPNFVKPSSQHSGDIFFESRLENFIKDGLHLMTVDGGNSRATLDHSQTDRSLEESSTRAWGFLRSSAKNRFVEISEKGKVSKSSAYNGISSMNYYMEGSLRGGGDDAELSLEMLELWIEGAIVQCELTLFVMDSLTPEQKEKALLNCLSMISICKEKQRDLLDEGANSLQKTELPKQLERLEKRIREANVEEAQVLKTCKRLLKAGHIDEAELVDVAQVKKDKTVQSLGRMCKGLNFQKIKKWEESSEAIQKSALELKKLRDLDKKGERKQRIHQELYGSIHCMMSLCNAVREKIHRTEDTTEKEVLFKELEERTYEIISLMPRLADYNFYVLEGGKDPLEFKAFWKETLGGMEKNILDARIGQGCLKKGAAITSPTQYINAWKLKCIRRQVENTLFEHFRGTYNKAVDNLVSLEKNFTSTCRKVIGETLEKEDIKEDSSKFNSERKAVHENFLKENANTPLIKACNDTLEVVVSENIFGDKSDLFASLSLKKKFDFINEELKKNYFDQEDEHTLIILREKIEYLINREEKLLKAAFSYCLRKEILKHSGLDDSSRASLSIEEPVMPLMSMKAVESMRNKELFLKYIELFQGKSEHFSNLLTKAVKNEEIKKISTDKACHNLLKFKRIQDRMIEDWQSKGLGVGSKEELRKYELVPNFVKNLLKTRPFEGDDKFDSQTPASLKLYGELAGIVLEYSVSDSENYLEDLEKAKKLFLSHAISAPKRGGDSDSMEEFFLGLEHFDLAMAGYDGNFSADSREIVEFMSLASGVQEKEILKIQDFKKSKKRLASISQGLGIPMSPEKILDCESSLSTVKENEYASMRLQLLTRLGYVLPDIFGEDPSKELIITPKKEASGLFKKASHSRPVDYKLTVGSKSASMQVGASLYKDVATGKGAGRTQTQTRSDSGNHGEYAQVALSETVNGSHKYAAHPLTLLREIRNWKKNPLDEDIRMLATTLVRRVGDKEQYAVGNIDTCLRLMKNGFERLSDPIICDAIETALFLPGTLEENFALYPERIPLKIKILKDLLDRCDEDEEKGLPCPERRAFLLKICLKFEKASEVAENVWSEEKDLKKKQNSRKRQNTIKSNLSLVTPKYFFRESAECKAIYSKVSNQFLRELKISDSRAALGKMINKELNHFKSKIYAPMKEGSMTTQEDILVYHEILAAYKSKWEEPPKGPKDMDILDRAHIMKAFLLLKSPAVDIGNPRLRENLCDWVSKKFLLDFRTLDRTEQLKTLTTMETLLVYNETRVVNDEGFFEKTNDCWNVSLNQGLQFYKGSNEKEFRAFLNLDDGWLELNDNSVKAMGKIAAKRIKKIPVYFRKNVQFKMLFEDAEFEMLRRISEDGSARIYSFTYNGQRFEIQQPTDELEEDNVTIFRVTTEESDGESLEVRHQFNPVLGDIKGASSQAKDFIHSHGLWENSKERILITNISKSHQEVFRYEEGHGKKSRLVHKKTGKALCFLKGRDNGRLLPMLGKTRLHYFSSKKLKTFDEVHFSGSPYRLVGKQLGAWTFFKGDVSLGQAILAGGKRQIDVYEKARKPIQKILGDEYEKYAIAITPKENKGGKKARLQETDVEHRFLICPNKIEVSGVPKKMHVFPGDFGDNIADFYMIERCKNGKMTGPAQAFLYLAYAAIREAEASSELDKKNELYLRAAEMLVRAEASPMKRGEKDLELFQFLSDNIVIKGSGTPTLVECALNLKMSLALERMDNKLSTGSQVSRDSEAYIEKLKVSCEAYQGYQELFNAHGKDLPEMLCLSPKPIVNPDGTITQELSKDELYLKRRYEETMGKYATGTASFAEEAQLSHYSEPEFAARVLNDQFLGVASFVQAILGEASKKGVDLPFDEQAKLILDVINKEGDVKKELSEQSQRLLLTVFKFLVDMVERSKAPTTENMKSANIEDLPDPLSLSYLSDNFYVFYQQIVKRKLEPKHLKDLIIAHETVKDPDEKMGAMMVLQFLVTISEYNRKMGELGGTGFPLLDPDKMINPFIGGNVDRLEGVIDSFLENLINKSPEDLVKLKGQVDDASQGGASSVLGGIKSGLTVFKHLNNAGLLGIKGSFASALQFAFHKKSAKKHYKDRLDPEHGILSEVKQLKADMLDPVVSEQKKLEARQKLALMASMAGSVTGGVSSTEKYVEPKTKSLGADWGKLYKDLQDPNKFTPEQKEVYEPVVSKYHKANADLKFVQDELLKQVGLIDDYHHDFASVLDLYQECKKEILEFKRLLEEWQSASVLKKGKIGIEMLGLLKILMKRRKDLSKVINEFKVPGFKKDCQVIAKRLEEINPRNAVEKIEELKELFHPFVLINTFQYTVGTFTDLRKSVSSLEDQMDVFLPEEIDVKELMGLSKDELKIKLLDYIGQGVLTIEQFHCLIALFSVYGTIEQNIIGPMRKVLSETLQRSKTVKDYNNLLEASLKPLNLNKESFLNESIQKSEEILNEALQAKKICKEEKDFILGLHKLLNKYPNQKAFKASVVDEADAADLVPKEFNQRAFEADAAKLPQIELTIDNAMNFLPLLISASPTDLKNGILDVISLINEEQALIKNAVSCFNNLLGLTRKDSSYEGMMDILNTAAVEAKGKSAVRINYIASLRKDNEILEKTYTKAPSAAPLPKPNPDSRLIPIRKQIPLLTDVKIDFGRVGLLSDTFYVATVENAHKDATDADLESEASKGFQERKAYLINAIDSDTNLSKAVKKGVEDLHLDPQQRIYRKIRPDQKNLKAFMDILARELGFCETESSEAKKRVDEELYSTDGSGGLKYEKFLRKKQHLSDGEFDRWLDQQFMKNQFGVDYPDLTALMLVHKKKLRKYQQVIRAMNQAEGLEEILKDMNPKTSKFGKISPEDAIKKKEAMKKWETASKGIYHILRLGYYEDRYADPSYDTYRRKLLVAECRSGFIYRESQLRFLWEAINDPSIFGELRMGQGKTSMILPTLLAIYADQGKLSCGVIPQSLFEGQGRETDEATRAMFEQASFVFRFKRASIGNDQEIKVLDEARLNLMKEYNNLLKVRKNKEYLLMTIESKASLSCKISEFDLKIQDMLDEGLEKGDNAKRFELMSDCLVQMRKIENLLHDDDTLLIIDEADDTLSPLNDVRFQLSSGKGATEKIPDFITSTCGSLIRRLFDKDFSNRWHDKEEKEAMERVRMAIYSKDSGGLDKEDVKLAKKVLCEAQFKQILNDTGFLSHQEVSEYSEKLTMQFMQGLPLSETVGLDELLRKKGGNNIRALLRDLGTVSLAMKEVFATILEKKAGVTYGIDNTAGSEGFLVVPFVGGLCLENIRYSDPISQTMHMLLYYACMPPNNEVVEDYLNRVQDPILAREWTINLKLPKSERLTGKEFLTGVEDWQVKARLDMAEEWSKKIQISTRQVRKAVQTSVRSTHIMCMTGTMAGHLAASSRAFKGDVRGRINDKFTKRRGVIADVFMRIAATYPIEEGQEVQKDPFDNKVRVYDIDPKSAGTSTDVKEFVETVTATKVNGKYRFQFIINQAGLYDHLSSLQVAKILNKKSGRPIVFIRREDGNDTKCVCIKGRVEPLKGFDKNLLDDPVYYYGVSDIRGIDLKKKKKFSDGCLYVSSRVTGGDFLQSAYRARNLGDTEGLEICVPKKLANTLVKGKNEQPSIGQLMKHILDVFTDPTAQEYNLKSWNQEIQGTAESRLSDALTKIAVDPMVDNFNLAASYMRSNIKKIIAGLIDDLEKGDGTDVNKRCLEAKEKIRGLRSSNQINDLNLGRQLKNKLYDFESDTLWEIDRLQMNATGKARAILTIKEGYQSRVEEWKVEEQGSVRQFISNELDDVDIYCDDLSHLDPLRANKKIEKMIKNSRSKIDAKIKRLEKKSDKLDSSIKDTKWYQSVLSEFKNERKSFNKQINELNKHKEDLLAFKEKALKDFVETVNKPVTEAKLGICLQTLRENSESVYQKHHEKLVISSKEQAKQQADCFKFVRSYFELITDIEAGSLGGFFGGKVVDTLDNLCILAKGEKEKLEILKVYLSKGAWERKPEGGSFEEYQKNSELLKGIPDHFKSILKEHVERALGELDVIIKPIEEDRVLKNGKEGVIALVERLDAIAFQDEKDIALESIKSFVQKKLLLGEAIDDKTIKGLFNNLDMESQSIKDSTLRNQFKEEVAQFKKEFKLINAYLLNEQNFYIHNKSFLINLENLELKGEIDKSIIDESIKKLESRDIEELEVLLKSAGLLKEHPNLESTLKLLSLSNKALTRNINNLPEKTIANAANTSEQSQTQTQTQTQSQTQSQSMTAATAPGSGGGIMAKLETYDRSKEVEPEFYCERFGNHISSIDNMLVGNYLATLIREKRSVPSCVVISGKTRRHITMAKYAMKSPIQDKDSRLPIFSNLVISLDKNKYGELEPTLLAGKLPSNEEALKDLKTQLMLDHLCLGKTNFGPRNWIELETLISREISWFKLEGQMRDSRVEDVIRSLLLNLKGLNDSGTWKSIADHIPSLRDPSGDLIKYLQLSRGMDFIKEPSPERGFALNE